MKPIIIPRGLPRQTEVALKSVKQAMASARQQSADGQQALIAGLQDQLNAIGRRLQQLEKSAGSAAAVQSTGGDPEQSIGLDPSGKLALVPLTVAPMSLSAVPDGVVLHVPAYCNLLTVASIGLQLDGGLMLDGGLVELAA